MNTSQKPDLLLVDGYSLLFRGFHALPLLTAPDGSYTNAIHGFFSMLFKALTDYRPQYLCVMMDVHAPTFRHTLYEEYKGTRKPMPEELIPQLSLVREMLSAMHVQLCEMEGYEADDLLGTAARMAGEQGLHTYVLTGDRDSLQLVNDHTEVILTRKGISESLLLDAQGVLANFSYTPEQGPDMKGLMGDSSDTIPGIAGVGEKTALKLILEYGTLDQVLAHADEVKGKLGEKLRAGREVALLSRDLGTIRVNAPLKLSFASCGWNEIQQGTELLNRYGLKSLARNMNTLMAKMDSGESSAREFSDAQDKGLAWAAQGGSAANANAATNAANASANAANANANATANANAYANATAYAAAANPSVPSLLTRGTAAAKRASSASAAADTGVSAMSAEEESTLPTPAALAGEAHFTTAEDITKAVQALTKRKPAWAALCQSDVEITVLTQELQLWHMPILRDLMGVGLYDDQIMTALASLFEQVPLIVHGAKALLGQLGRFRMPMPHIAMDTMLGAYLLHTAQKGYSLEVSLQTEYEKTAEELPKPLTAYDVYALSLRQQARIEARSMQALLNDMELPLTRVLYQMEREGFLVDDRVLMELSGLFTKEIEECRQSVYTLTGLSDFNLNSPKQLGEVLFDKLGLPAQKKSKQGAYSTDAEVLEGLIPYHAAIEPLLRYRKLSKLQSTYVEGLLKLRGRDGRVRTTFDQTATVTGRISSLEPNLQNIPIRTEEGREIRRAFVAGEGCVLLDADYSQIELRVLAHMSGDAAMCDAFQKGQDIHTRTAAEIHGVSMEEVTPALRRSAKAINFGIVYGISGFGLARNTGISRKEADQFITKYFERYPGVRAFMDDCVR
ncbi:MAG: DNA polymerase I, partial [Clostridia bacterium]